MDEIKFYTKSFLVGVTLAVMCVFGLRAIFGTLPLWVGFVSGVVCTLGALWFFAWREL